MISSFCGNLSLVLRVETRGETDQLGLVPDAQVLSELPLPLHAENVVERRRADTVDGADGDARLRPFLLYSCENDKDQK